MSAPTRAGARTQDFVAELLDAAAVLVSRAPAANRTPVRFQPVPFLDVADWLTFGEPMLRPGVPAPIGAVWPIGRIGYGLACLCGQLHGLARRAPCTGATATRCPHRLARESCYPWTGSGAEGTLGLAQPIDLPCGLALSATDGQLAWHGAPRPGA